MSYDWKVYKITIHKSPYDDGNTVVEMEENGQAVSYTMTSINFVYIIKNIIDALINAELKENK